MWGVSGSLPGCGRPIEDELLLVGEAATGAGFRALLTRDRLFGESAGRALERFPELGVVVVRLPQAREVAYLAEFRKRWPERFLCPVPGQVIEWP